MKSDKIPWRKWNKLLHRDIGYLSAGLTLIYALSGIAVNHVRDWNPNYTVDTVTATISFRSVEQTITGSDITEILAQLNEKRAFKNFHQPDKNTLLIFLEDADIRINLQTGDAITRTITNRRVFREVNFLHLNEPKSLWTWFADLYAIALMFLAISGLFMVKGKKGLVGRGWKMAGAGLLIPIIFLLVYF